MDFRTYWEQIYLKKEELQKLIESYWSDYSDLGTWQFWLVLSLFIIPLIILYFAVDRKRVFEVLFFGYTVHILWGYINIVLENYSLFVHFYFILPYFPFALSMNASALPVGFLLVYQYCVNNEKNFYLYGILISLFYAYGVASIENSLGLVELRGGIKQYHVFLIDLVIAYISYWFTRLLFHAHKKAKHTPE